ncbi:tRNA (Guanine-1)-methyltransferase [Popillia japonica]|uniref:tRNA (guanine(9)-N(1))-methyltransferase n=1 Tax=Popillia japonica TaxID=7064 RepID=A0AAW1MFA0_POPJA
MTELNNLNDNIESKKQSLDVLDKPEEIVNPISNIHNPLSENKVELRSNNEKEAATLFNGVEISKLTKRQLKKYRRMLQWNKSKKEKRAKERLRLKSKKKFARKNNIDLGPSRKQLKRCTMENSPCKTTVVIDLSFDDLMIDKDMGKVIKQILRIYTENRRSMTPMQLYITNFNGRSKLEMEKHNGYEHWDINFHSENYLDIFPKEKLVYLTSESDNDIMELSQDKVYIIGGLVDHNAHKGLCYKTALEQGIGHGRLPITEYFFTKHRKVFTINQVFEILLRVSEGKSFKCAFELVLPKRINIQPAASSKDS